MNTMKTIIITGANGNLGSAVVKKMLEAGYKIIATDSRDNNLQFALGDPNFELHNVDLTKEAEAASFINNSTAKHTKIDAALMLVGGFAVGNIAATPGLD